MEEFISTLVIVVFLLIGITIFAGITLKLVKRKKAVEAIEEPAKQECVSAVVVNKQFFYKRIVQKNAPALNKPQFVVTFKTDSETIHLNVAPESFDGFKAGETGTLKYKGDLLIDFITEGRS